MCLAGFTFISQQLGRSGIATLFQFADMVNYLALTHFKTMAKLFNNKGEKFFLMFADL